MEVVLSPHLDDAVLSCWSVLTERESAIVVNVFAGVPPGGTDLRWWDRLTGAVDSPARMRERLAEDVAALALSGRKATNLDALDRQYRDAGAAPPLVDLLLAELPDRAALYAPAGFGGHPDHLLVRDAALELARRGHPVTLYADLPHAIPRGWPSWVRRDGVPSPEVDDEWREQMDGADPVVRELDREVHAAKVQAVMSYRSQVAALDAMAFRPLLHPWTLRYEVFWPVR
jgi:LmbE family N-acetylglucosaminyl deacetylase